MANKKTALVLRKEETDIIKQVGGTLFKDIDYAAMDTSIEALGNYTGELTPEERVAASGVIGDFENRIVSTLNNKSHKLNFFQNLLKLSPHTNENEVKRFLREEAVEILLSQDVFSKYLDEYHKLQDEVSEIEDYAENEKPMQPFIDNDTMTPLQAASIRSTYQIKLRKYESALRKKNYTLCKNFYAFKKNMNADTNYKHFMDALGLQLKDAEQATDTVKEKCSYAKMNILIASAEVRQVLRDLHDFAKTIK